MNKKYTEKEMDDAYDKGIMTSKAAPQMLQALQNLENDNNQIPEHAWKMVQEAINLALNSKKRESKSFFNLKTIADIKKIYPNQESYGVSVSKGLLKFYVNNNVIYTKAVNYFEECTEVAPEVYKQLKNRKNGIKENL
jgi:hypothetical protein